MNGDKLKLLLLCSLSALALAGCGADDISSPGTGGNVTINNGTGGNTGGNNGGNNGGGTVTPASGCPTIADPQGLKDDGTITGPTGTYRVCTLPARINTSIRLTKVSGLLYQMAGRVDVGTDGGFTASSSDTNVTLTIDPGVILFGGTGQSWLAVNRGNKISAVGTATQPIIFTSRDNVLGLNTETSQGQWGGVVLMGRGRVTDCTTGSVAAGTCERQTEGAADPARFGGANDADNSGRMSFVQIRYSGFVLGANVELQSLTGEGVGSGTVIDHIMSYNSSDDGSEWFGGSPNMKHYIAVGADDDSIDVDTGARMNVQFALLIQRSGAGDALNEIDSNGFETDTPRTKLQMSNFTMIQPAVSSNNEANDQASALYRGNSDVTLVNSVIASPNNECIRMNGSGATPATLTAHSVGLNCNATKFLGTGSYNATQVAGFFNAGTNNRDTFTPTFSGGFINGSNETGLVAFNVTPLSAFFTAVTYIGAVKDSADTWYAGWTCNSTAANFGSGNSGACTSLPTT
ncbi:MAG: hypothetical protein EPO51_16245 [Phenylobacterium sp.]|uniref:hypothetical protein n=1 Tax=Phenylobacterium sp. TaxID=1871053 RepID=UPI0011FE4CEA|nr:hypothetical protein [Phenylobacterium sp.]TAJ70645.1 MAG: hypothetical protein EPO51_16245 [Phenylobacterium sp.]